MLETASLSPMQSARLTTALDKLTRRNGIVRTLRAHLEADAAAGPLELSESDGMIDYDRRRFNRMDYAEQRAYEARLKAKRYFWANGWQLPKIVFDALQRAQNALL